MCVDCLCVPCVSVTVHIESYFIKLCTVLVSSPSLSLSLSVYVYMYMYMFHYWLNTLADDNWFILNHALIW